jgi:hypothetical protein
MSLIDWVVNVCVNVIAIVNHYTGLAVFFTHKVVSPTSYHVPNTWPITDRSKH